MNLNIKILTELAELDAIASEWDELALQAPQQSPLMSHAWLSSFFSVYQQGIDWFVVVAFAGGRLVGVLPLTVCKSSAVLGESTYLRLPKNNHTLSVDAAVLKNYQSILREMHKAAFQHRPASHIEYSRIDAVSDNFHWFKSKEGLMIQTDLNGFGCSVEPNLLFDDYYSALSKNHRGNLNNSKNKLKNSSLVESVFSHENTDEFFNAVFDMEHTGWKGRANTSVLSNALDAQFFRNLADALNKKGWLYYQLLRIDDGYIAGNFSVLFNRKQLLWKLAYSDVHAKASPGSILLLEVIERALAKQETVDLMTNEKWYENWNMQKRPFFDIYVYNTRSLRGVVMALLKKVRLSLAQLKKRLGR